MDRKGLWRLWVRQIKTLAEHPKLSGCSKLTGSKNELSNYQGVHN